MKILIEKNNTAETDRGLAEIVAAKKPSNGRYQVRVIDGKMEETDKRSGPFNAIVIIQQSRSVKFGEPQQLTASEIWEDLPLDAIR